MKPMPFASIALVVILASCRGEPKTSTVPAPAPATAEGPGEHDHGNHGKPDAHGSDDGDHRGPGGAKTSDLDQPVDALLAKTCEHQRKTFECPECRYEVGVARVPKAMRDAGLVKTSTVERRRLETPLPLTGELKFDERRVAHIAPTTEARVRAVRVSLGQRVLAGAPLIELESVALGEAQSQYLEARSALELARRAADRADSLRQEKIASEKEWLQARAEHQTAEIRTRAAREKLVRLGLSREQLETLSAKGAAGGRGELVLKAPSPGTVLEMHAVPGELIRPDQSIVTLGDLSDLWLWADLYEDQLGRVVSSARQTLRAGVTVKAYPGEVFPGTVDFVGPTMDEKTRTVKVRIGVKNPDGKLRAGMFAAVLLYLPGNEEALAVPRSAVLSDEGRSFVFIHHHDDFFIRRPVEVGRTSVDWAEVKTGLQGGETVVEDGAFLLKSDVLRSKMGAGCAD